MDKTYITDAASNADSKYALYISNGNLAEGYGPFSIRPVSSLAAQSLPITEDELW